MRKLLVVSCWLWIGVGALAQDAQRSPPAPGAEKSVPEKSVTPSDTNSPGPLVRRGIVLFERHEDSPGADATPLEEKRAEDVGAQAQMPKSGAGLSDSDVQVSDVERSALTFSKYDLDVRLKPAKAELEMHARFSVTNTGKEPLTKVALQISSSLTWERITVMGTDAAFVQHLIDTDADHTGQAQEAIITLREPLASGRSIDISTFYSGTVERTARRLEAMGVPLMQAAAADWDGISAAGTALRGYGNVLWYPVATPQAFLGDGAKLFQAAGEMKLRQAATTIKLRLTIQYTGDAPRAAYFCGRMELLTATSEDIDAPAARAPGVATASFAERALGFRMPSLFVPEGDARVMDGGLLSVVAEEDAAAERYARAAALVQPLLADWLGETPMRPLTLLKHGGQRFEDEALLVGPMDQRETGGAALELSHPLSHAWFASSHVWLDEGVAQFMSYLWMERDRGREIALQHISEQTQALALVEPAVDAPNGSGQSLIEPRDEVYFRTKAAAVLWMLRSVVGDEVLKQALQTYNGEVRRDARRDRDAKEFQRVLEEVAKKDLKWFFDDWVYLDRGLPDLSIVSVNPRQLTAKDGRGGWLIAVEVKNEGAAAAEVPVTVRSGKLTQTVRLRVLGRSSASTRIVFESDPEEVVVNDGSVPEVRAGMHVRQLRVKE